MNTKILEIMNYGQLITKMVVAKHHETAQRYNLSLEQFHLLIEIDELELDISDDTLPPTVGQIAANIGNAPHTLSEKIKRLEKKKLVEKIRDSADLRITRVVLTESGRNLVKHIKNEAGNTFIFNTLAKMSNQSLDSLSDSLRQFTELLSIERKE